MKNKVFLSVLLTLLAFTVGKAQTAVLSYTPGVTTDGVVYFLPKTVLKIAVTSTRITSHPGDFHNYAKRFLRLNNVIQEEDTQWKIDNVQVVCCSEPDTSKSHIVLLKKGTSAPLCSLTDNGVLLAVNAQTSYKAEDKVDVVNKKTTEKVNSRDYLNEEILLAGSELKMAELTATEIYSIRESKNELAKGEADYMPKDGEQLKLMLSKLEEQEFALMQLFKGYQESETRTDVFYYVPKYGVEKEIAARFSTKRGLVGNDDLGGSPIYVTVINKNTVPYGKTELSDKKLVDRVLYYNVPSMADVKLSFGDRTLYNRQLPLAQFGREEYLSEDLFNKRATCHIWFNPLTGNIERVDDSSLKK